LAGDPHLVGAQVDAQIADLEQWRKVLPWRAPSQGHAQAGVDHRRRRVDDDVVGAGIEEVDQELIRQRVGCQHHDAPNLGGTERATEAHDIEVGIAQIDEREVGMEGHDALDDPPVDAQRDDTGRPDQGLVEERLGGVERGMTGLVGAEQGDHGCLPSRTEWRAGR
jgi:hypothetical protein